jgi:diguanylate cyclase (GGDEF)-like protein
MRILVAEDSPAQRLALSRAVEALGHELVAAADGRRAWELFRQQGFDVVVSDWMMPGIEGDELCRRIRGAGGSYTYVIILTSLEDKRHLMTGMRAGADDYLNKPLDVDELEARLAAASRVTSLHAQLAEQRRELGRLNEELSEQARQDPLTDTGNRLRMHEDLDRLESELQRSGRGYALLLCDIDRFKSYNDSRGHQRGDEVLRTVAATLRELCRRGDAVYRYGGEELLVSLPGADLDAAVRAGERIRRRIEELAIAHPGRGDPGVVTISVGAAVRDAGTPGGAEGVIGRADRALYEAKDAGRNRVADVAS